MFRPYMVMLLCSGVITFFVLFFLLDIDGLSYEGYRTSTGKRATFENLPAKKTHKWIVVTSIQEPTEDVKRLALLPEWTLVVVGDKKTPIDWSLPDVHYLSPEMQEALGYSILENVPWGSYGRKNIGYLYAIQNGAQWIYDTDDDNKPFGKGLEQFDYDEVIMGLRFTGIENSTELSDHLLNPYRHFGVESMWPRGFPLDLIKEHSHKEGSYRLCKAMRTPAVQQGIVQKDPDVDAIYRLLHASPTDGLQERFNKFAPPVVLAPGTYSPINSQNTLFRRDAFFSLFLPLTVSFRACDIWRGYYAQILMHLIGEAISFVPANARQLRNAHNYLKDFDQEIDVYEKSGEILAFARDWKCRAESTEGCMIELAEEFADRKFWSKEEVVTITQWVEDLKRIRYEFPPLHPNARLEYPLSPDPSLEKNCRRAHFDATLNLPEENTQPAVLKAEQSIANFEELQEWCMEANSTVAEQWAFPDAEEEAERILKNETLTANHDVVAIVTNNYMWQISMGLQQRMYEGAFGHFIFCGTIPPPTADGNDGMSPIDKSFPKLRKPVTYVYLSNEEVKWGFWMYLCMVKVAEMRLQNVKAYVMFSDDMIYNVWHPLDQSKAHSGIRAPGVGMWWASPQFGQKAANNSIELVKGKYSKNKEVLWMLEEYKRLLAPTNISDANKNLIKDPLLHMNLMDGWIVSDWIYMPSQFIELTRVLGQVFFEGGLFHEIFFSKLLWLLPHEMHPTDSPNGFKLLWGAERDMWDINYTEIHVGIHPVKASMFVNLTNRRRFCDNQLNIFHNNLFGREQKLANMTF